MDNRGGYRAAYRARIMNKRATKNMLAGFHFIEHTPNFLTPEETKAVRAKLAREKKAAYKHHALQWCVEQDYSPKWLEDAQAYELHHIIPVSLGGNNDKANLVVVRPALHTHIHFYINQQIITNKALKRPSARLLIPIRPEPVWI